MTMITPSYLGETIEYSSLHACRSTLEDPTVLAAIERAVRYHAFSCYSLERILAVQARPRPALESLDEQYRPSLTDDTPIRPRPTADYQELLEEPDDHEPQAEAES